MFSTDVFFIGFAIDTNFIQFSTDVFFIELVSDANCMELSFKVIDFIELATIAKRTQLSTGVKLKVLATDAYGIQFSTAVLSFQLSPTAEGF